MRKDLRESAAILREEESYGFRNVHDRCHFILFGLNKLQNYYNLARNDNNLKIARTIFRYRHNLDNIFSPIHAPGDLKLAKVNDDGLAIAPSQSMESTGGLVSMENFPFLNSVDEFCKGI